ncbi:MAG: hypothetical protein A3I66_22890 [Burkholderiales bacterium RIFCSPLOWO2_02_FULL_57_36]|nr:MAG: hypothetical protein A3I66_22890 [Burkholderiales bacterium RIFCSPLOWO2_02_FULL_57_36]
MFIFFPSSTDAGKKIPESEIINVIGPLLAGPHADAPHTPCGKNIRHAAVIPALTAAFCALTNVQEESFCKDAAEAEKKIGIQAGNTPAAPFKPTPYSGCAEVIA